MTFYLNGESVEAVVDSDTLTSEVSVRQPVRLGVRASNAPFQGQLRDVRLYGRVLNSADAEAVLASPFADLARVPPAQRSDEQKAALTRWYRSHQHTAARAGLARIESAEKELRDFSEKVPTVMVMAELDKPRDTFILIRGQYDQHGDKVTHDVPSALPPLLSDEPRTRLGLARWLVSPRHPLTARVTVNRLWERFFGTGLVKTTEDFGLQGDLPQNAELLDWLAAEFMSPRKQVAGWDLKQLQRLIVTSAVYRQSSVVSPALVQRDPENRLLARGPRFRLNAEAIRDSALAVSGLLVEKPGGPSVKPYQPPGVWEELVMVGVNKYEQDHGEALYRRTLYTFVRRTAQQPSLALFDAPSREVCIVKRPRTNTPLQALGLQNDTIFLESARNLAQEMLSRSGSPAERLAWGFRKATARTPRPAELAILVQGFERRLADYQRDPDAAAKLLAIGESAAPGKFSPVELAAYTTASSVILNLDEVVTRQ